MAAHVWNSWICEQNCGLEAGTRVWAVRKPTAADLMCCSSIGLHPIDSLKPGDFVLDHEAKRSVIHETATSRIEDWIVELRTDSHATRLQQTHRVLAKLRPRTLGGNRDWSASPDEHSQRRRQLRREGTEVERRLWSVLRSSTTGFKFRRQHSLGPYIADFYCREAHLVVEIDGEHHYTDEGREHDRRRDRFLRELGLDVFRIPVPEVDDNLDDVWLAIQRQCKLRIESVDGANWVQAGSLQPGDLLVEISEETESLRTQPLRSVHSERREAMICRFKLEEPRPVATEACVVFL